MPNEDDDDVVVIEQSAPPPKQTAPTKGRGKAPKQTKEQQLADDPGYQAYVKLSGGTPRKVDGKFATPGEKLFGDEAPATEREAAEGAQPEQQAAPAAKEPKAPPKAPAASAAEREAFLGLARRFKVPVNVADAAMAGDRDALLAWTAELSTMQARFDELSARGAEPKGAPGGDAQEPKAGTPKAAKAGAPAGSEPGSDIRAQLVEALADEGLSEKFADTLLAIVKPGKNPDATTMEALAEQIRVLHETQARTALKKEFKGLTSDKAFKSVRARVARWIASGVFEPNQVEEAMRESCKVEFYNSEPHSGATDDDEEAEEPDARDEGSPTVPRRGTKVTSTGDPGFDAYVALSRGAQPKNVRSRLTR